MKLYIDILQKNKVLAIIVFCASLIVVFLVLQKQNIKKPKSSSTIQIANKLDLHSMLKPVPLTAKLTDDNFYTWGGSMIRSPNNGKYHMYYSRWPKNLGFNAWVSHSEIAHAISDSATGPFEFKDVTLPARGRKYWDGLVAHNPTIHYFDNKYYLYYMGNTGDGKIVKNGLNWTHRNNQRIGVAVSNSLEGPWIRFEQPLIDVSKSSIAHDALMVSNPSVTQMPDGRILMVYKAVAKRTKLPFGGPVTHLTAISELPTGPFIKQMKPVFTAQDTEFPAEDPYIWYDKKKGNYYAIVKDMNGAFTKIGRSLVLFRSKDGLDWKLAENALVSELKIKWQNNDEQKLHALERPQLYFEAGRPIVLLAAANVTEEHSFNVQIPLEIE